MNGTTLKWVAIVTMLIDHMGAICFPQYQILRVIGRMSFPIFCFLLTEGFYHTRNVKKYMLRLGIFAFISEIPFDYGFEGSLFFWDAQNVFFTLFIGLCTLYFAEQCYLNQRAGMVTFVVIAGGFVAMVLQTDYSYVGVLAVFIIYQCRSDAYQRNILLMLLFAFLYDLRLSYMLSIAFALLLIYQYNGEKGGDKAHNANTHPWADIINMQYFFYWFYPAHILLLAFIQRITP